MLWRICLLLYIFYTTKVDDDGIEASLILKLDVLIDNLHADGLCATLTLCDITKEIEMSLNRHVGKGFSE